MKFLDINGVTTLWNKIKDKFVEKQTGGGIKVENKGGDFTSLQTVTITNDGVFCGAGMYDMTAGVECGVNVTSSNIYFRTNSKGRYKFDLNKLIDDGYLVLQSD